MFGYVNNWLKVNLTGRTVEKIEIADDILRKYVGGTGIGARLLYDMVEPGTEWNDPENCIVVASGPLNGLQLAGVGAFSVVTKGPMTNGAASSQACGYFGTYMKFSGIDGFVIEGAADSWVYLYLNQGNIEIRDAGFLTGLDTIETEECLKEKLELPDHKSSVYSIGPAGENGVRFSVIAGDEGHIAAHNGVGTVFGSKKLKAMVAVRGPRQYSIFDEEKTKILIKEMRNKFIQHPKYGNNYKFGTSHLLGNYTSNGVLPIKNLTTSVFDEKYLKLCGEYYRNRFEMKPTPCWACPAKHCHKVTVTEGPYTGVVGEEPEYELFAGFGSMIGNDDPGAVIMLNDVCDRLGLEGNETSWLIAFLMECYEKGVLTKEQLDGLELTWGNAKAVKELLYKIAKCDGIGKLFAEGIMRVAETIGGEALNMAVYVKKGHAPRGHDHRARWTELLDTVVSNVGTIESIGAPVKNAFDPVEVAKSVAKSKLRNFVDSLVICMFPSMTMTHLEAGHLVELVNSVTGWNYTMEEAHIASQRIVNLFRVFNFRHGHTAEMEYPSVRYGSAPVDGPVEGISVMDVWETMRTVYYESMGWDRKTGIPLKNTLIELGLEDEAKDLESI